MAKPYVHAQSSAIKFGGKPEDYLPIHEMMDSSKSAFPDTRHRALTHNSWFISTIIDRIFGSAIKNSDGKMVPVRDIAEQHVAEDFGDKFIPSAQDYLIFMEARPWMSNTGEYPPSAENIQEPHGPKTVPKENRKGFPNTPKPVDFDDLRRQIENATVEPVTRKPFYDARGPMRFD